MADFFGFHGERSGGGGDRTLGRLAPGAMKAKAGKRRPSSALPTPLRASTGPNINPAVVGGNTMTYNASYSVQTVQPPSLNSGLRPPRKATNVGGGALQRNSGGGGPLNPLSQIVSPPQPINAAQLGQSSGSVASLMMNAPASSSNMNTGSSTMDLQKKVQAFRQKKLEASQSLAPQVVAQPPPPSLALPKNVEPSQPTTANTNHTDLTRYQSEINLTVDSLRKEISSLQEEVKHFRQISQKCTLDQNSIKETMTQLQTLYKAHQSQLDEVLKVQFNASEKDANREDVLTTAEMQQLLEEFQEEQKQLFGKLQSDVKDSIQKVSDRSYWFYGTVLADSMHTYESHELNSRKRTDLKKGSKVLLSYPMEKTREGVWVRAKGISDDGTVSVSWVPLWTFTKDVLAKFQDSHHPPKDEAKTIYLGHFGFE
jgi:hypothetical protein